MLENATDEELIDSGMYFGIRNFDYFGTGIDPIWSEASDIAEQEKRRENETAEEYVARAYPPDYVKDCQVKHKKKAEEMKAKKEEEEKQKKLRKKRDQVNDLKRFSEENQTELEELRVENTECFSEYQKEHHQRKIDYCEEVIPIYKSKLTDKNYLDLY